MTVLIDIRTEGFPEELEAIDQERDEKIKELTCQKSLDV